MKIFSTLFLLACLGAASVASANDYMAGGVPTGLVPLETKQVRMVAEDILIAADGKDWAVTADYTFENLSARDVAATVGFPEPACQDAGKPFVPDPDERCVPEMMRFRHMETMVDGAAVAHRKGSVAAKHAWATHLGAVWLYDVRFPAKQQVRVLHRYRVSQGEYSSGLMTGQYVTRTGAPWAGSIGRARFRIHVPAEAHTADVEIEGTGLSLTKHLVDVEGKKVGELLLEASDWNPTHDISFNFNARYMELGAALMDFGERQEMRRASGNPRCSGAALGAIVGAIRAQSESATPVMPSSELIEQLVSEGVGTPAICRDFIYALHGRRFDSYHRNLHFYGYAGHVPGSWPFAYLEPNADYTDAMITQHDLAGFRLIDALEKRLAPCEACKPCERCAGEAPVATRTGASGGCRASGNHEGLLLWTWLLAVVVLAARSGRARLSS